MLRTIVGITAVLILFWQLAPAQQDEKTPPVNKEALREPSERFNGTTKVRIRDRNGETRVVDVRVSIHNWILNGQQRLSSLPFRSQGFLIVQLRGGSLTTIINGQRQERKEDEFWTVPSESQMGLETEDDSAIIQTIVIGAT